MSPYSSQISPLICWNVSNWTRNHNLLLQFDLFVYSVEIVSLLECWSLYMWICSFSRTLGLDLQSYFPYIQIALYVENGKWKCQKVEKKILFDSLSISIHIRFVFNVHPKHILNSFSILMLLLLLTTLEEWNRPKSLFLDDFTRIHDDVMLLFSEFISIEIGTLKHFQFQFNAIHSPFISSLRSHHHHINNNCCLVLISSSIESSVWSVVNGSYI